jgi:sarcosine oxidase subunit alpha
MNSNFDFDVAVIGAGPAGMVSATICAQSGVSVLLLERNPWAGGKLGIQTHVLQGPATIYSGLTGFEHQTRLMNCASDAGVIVRLGVEVSGLSRSDDEGRLFQLNVEGLLDFDGSVKVRAVILATGSEEPVTDFPGSGMHGVLRSGIAQVALNVRSQLVGRRIVMAGADNTGLLIAKNLLDAGAEVVAVLEEGTRIEGREFNAAPLRQAGVEILTSTRLIEAVGDGKLERVRVQSMESTEAPVRDIEADTLCLAFPRVPELQLARDVGCQVMNAEIFGGEVPIHGRNFVTTTEGLYVCGDASGVESGATAMETGRLAGLSASKYLGLGHPESENLMNLSKGRLGYLRRGRRGAMRIAEKRNIYSQYLRLTDQ